jgi:hypothetical protein
MAAKRAFDEINLEKEIAADNLLPTGTRGKIYILLCSICEYRYCVLISIIDIVDWVSIILRMHLLE